MPEPGPLPPDAALPVPDPRIEALLPAALLQEGERVILLLKPSPWFVLLAPLGTLLSLFAVTAAGVVLDRWLNAGRMAPQISAMGAAITALRVGWQILEWLSRTYVLTDRRVLRTKGVLRVQSFEAPLHRLQHTELLLSLRERLFGLGTIALSTAGTGTIEAAWVMVNDPLTVHRTLVNAIQNAGGHPD